MDKFKKRFGLPAHDATSQGARIKVIGVGGGGSNAVDYMSSNLVEDVECYVANTDSQALDRSSTNNKLQFGNATTRGLGAGFNPQVGYQAALEDRQKIVDYIGDADMMFITAGLGGGTGTGAAPVFAQAIKESHPESLLVAVVTMPFSFEGPKRLEYAKAGAWELRKSVDSIITIANDKILAGEIPLLDAYCSANDVLLNAVRGISDVIVRTGFVNVDFADVKTVMSEEGLAMMAHGAASGEDRASKVAESVLDNPLLEDIDLADAKGLLVNVTASSSISTREYQTVSKMINDVASNAEAIVSGLVFDEDIGDEIRVTIVASGLKVPHEENFEEYEHAGLFREINPFPKSEFQEEFEFSRDEDTEQYSEPETVTSPFIEDYHDQHEDEQLEQDPENVPSILRNRGNFSQDRVLNGSAEIS